ncbi:MAG: AAA family ATPase [Gemmatimonadetes bacterium]|nr:AAA family ATPase [Gemmatimonadota bacterium]
MTFFVGENGSGKSTLLECIAAAATLPTVGAQETARDDSLTAQRALAAALRLTWNRRTRKGFFLRAEDFFGFQKRVVLQRRELRQRVEEVDAAYAGASDLARGLAKGPAAGQLQDIARRYGENPDGRSHGEAFLALFQARFAPGGLYLLDEPEAALSPQSQLGFLTMLLDMVKRDAQFIIATHSPMILAFPDARIYSFDELPVHPVAYHELNHVRLMRDFLNDPEEYLRKLRS